MRYNSKEKMNMSTRANTPLKLKRLAQSSIPYLGCATIGGATAIILNRPAEFGRFNQWLTCCAGITYELLNPSNSTCFWPLFRLE